MQIARDRQHHRAERGGGNPPQGRCARAEIETRDQPPLRQQGGNRPAHHHLPHGPAPFSGVSAGPAGRAPESPKIPSTIACRYGRRKKPRRTISTGPQGGNPAQPRRGSFPPLLLSFRREAGDRGRARPALVIRARPERAAAYLRLVIGAGASRSNHQRGNANRGKSR